MDEIRKTEKVKYCLVNSKGEPKIEFSHPELMFLHMKNQEERHGKPLNLLPARVVLTTEITLINENNQD